MKRKTCHVGVGLIAVSGNLGVIDAMTRYLSASGLWVDIHHSNGKRVGDRR